MQENLNMQSKQHGLTVGELTIAIGALIIATILWTTINKKENTSNVSNISGYKSIPENMLYKLEMENKTFKTKVIS